MDLSREDVRRQLELEAESRSLGEARYARSRPMPWKTGADAASAEEEADLPPGQHLVRLAVEPTAAAIRQWVEATNSGKAGRRHSAVKWLELASPEEVAYLAARVVLNSAALRLTLQRTAIQLASAIIDHVDMVVFKGKNPAGYTGLIRKSRKGNSSARRLMAVRKMLEKEESRTAIPPAEKLHLGMVVIELVIEATGLFALDMVPRPGGKGYIIRANEAVQKWLVEQHARSALLEPLLLPMVVRPRRWRNPRAGGYLRRLFGRGFIKHFDKGYQARLHEHDLGLVYEAVNHIQETPWRINKRVLDVMREAWDGGGSFAGLPPRDDKPLPGKPVDFEENEEARKVWKREASVVHEANAQLFSSRLTMQQRLWVADKFADETAIWFPHSLDFRGRTYPLPAAGVHPQADDAGKALLEFAHALPIGKAGGYWLAVHIANLFGVDKVAFKDRVQWTYDHAEQLLDSALNPLDGQRFWLQADSPWMALAAAFEFADFLEHGETYGSRLPIPQDGSNSGLQHFSALLRDTTGARAVNLVPSSVPSDVYEEVARIAQAWVDADPSPEADPWRGGRITRKIAKRPTMTYVYSATRFGMQDMILKTLRELDEEGEPYLGGADNYEAAKYLSYVMFKAVGEVVSAATAAMEWLREVAKVTARAGVPMVWTTPDGFPVQQSYRVPYGKKVAVHWKGKRIVMMLAQDSSEIDTRGQANGIAPNFVHSLDAAHLRALARAAKDAGIDHLAVIHDSFATHAARSDELARLLRETFVKQYEPDLLARFRDEVVAALPEGWADEVPPLPPMGDLDLGAVLHSPYLFA
jgi:DNA-directed RNA polymerase